MFRCNTRMHISCSDGTFNRAPLFTPEYTLVRWFFDDMLAPSSASVIVFGMWAAGAGLALNTQSMMIGFSGIGR